MNPAPHTISAGGKYVSALRALKVCGDPDPITLVAGAAVEPRLMALSLIGELAMRSDRSAFATISGWLRPVDERRVAAKGGRTAAFQDGDTNMTAGSTSALTIVAKRTTCRSDGLKLRNVVATTRPSVRMIVIFATRA